MSATIQLIVNGENFLTRRHVARTLDEIVDPATRDFNFERFSCTEHGIGRIIGSFQTPPMMAETRTVVVEDLEVAIEMKKKKEDQEESDQQEEGMEKTGGLAKKNAEALARYFENPNPDTNIILITRKIDKRTSLYKILGKRAGLIEFKRPYPNMIPKFLHDESLAMGIELENGSSQILVDVAGTDLARLVMELEKLKLFVHPKTRVSCAHVAALVGTGVIDQIWILSEAVSKRDLPLARDLSRRMLEQGEHPVALVGLLVAHFRKLSLACDHAATHRNDLSLETLLGVSPYAAKQYASQARHCTPRDLKKKYRSLMRLSVDLRQSGASQGTLFQDFVQGVCLD